MKGKKVLSVSLATMLIVTMAVFNAGVVFASPLPYLSIEPPTTTYTSNAPGDNLNVDFDVRVEVHDVIDYYGCDFQVTYDASLLSYLGFAVFGPNAVVNVDNGNPLPLGALTITDVSVAGTVKGSVLFKESYDMDPVTPGIQSPPSFNGTGVVAWITFRIILEPPQGTFPPDPEYNTLSCGLDFVEAWTFIYDSQPAVQPRDPCVNGQYTIRMKNLIPGAPTADFTYTPAIPFVCDTVTCTDTSDPGPSPAVIISWLWTISGPATMTTPNDENVMKFHCDGPGDVTVTLTVTNDFQLSDSIQKVIPQREVVGCVLDVYTSDNRFCGQTTDWVGKGLGEPCDALSPDVNITLFAKVTWNNAPVNHVLVAFEVLWEYYIDWQACGQQQEPPTGYNSCVLYRTAETDKDGIARIWFRVPTPCDQMMFGKWIAIATAKIQEVKQEDTMRFDVGHLITLTEVYTEASTYIRDCDLMTIHVKGKSIAWMEKQVTIIVVAYDDCDVPIGQKVAQVSINPGMYCSPNNFEIILYDAIHVPQWAYVGIGKVYASAFTAIPSQCGVPYCPEKSSVFEILYVA